MSAVFSASGGTGVFVTGFSAWPETILAKDIMLQGLGQKASITNREHQRSRGVCDSTVT